MRILFCTPASLTKSLGAAKVVIELAEEMQTLGWDCQLISIKDLATESGESMSESLRRYLQKHAGDYDVVDYDHEYLPYPRSEFASRTLFVARSVLLTHHLETISIPRPGGIKPFIGNLVNGKKRRHKYREMVFNAHRTMQEADVINVSNQDDKAELMKRGISSGKVFVMPYGISTVRRPQFDHISSTVLKQPKVAFVGTFDYRKGAKEFPNIVRSVAERIPGIKFCLLGVKGMFSTENEIRAQFPKRSRHTLEIAMSYAPEELPQMLSSCSVGIFPSYMEGMPFGILEMLAASVPVIAYDTPGAPMLLPPDYLVPRGDWQGISDKVISLLQNENALTEARRWAKDQSQLFSWKSIARETSDIYLDCTRKDRGV